MTRGEHAAYLAGIIDGEGCVYAKDSRRKVTISNTEPSIIAAACEALDALDIRYTIYSYSPRSPKLRPVTIISVHNRAGLAIIAREVPLRSKPKVETLKTAITSYCWEIPKREELHTLYVEQQLSLKEIAGRWGRSQTHVKYWLRQYGIKVRTKREAGLIAWRSRRTLPLETSSPR